MARVQMPPALGRIPFLDAVLAGALCVLAVGGLVTGAVDEGPLAATLPAAVASTLAIAVRTRWPVMVTGLVTAAAVIQTLAAGHMSQSLWSLVVFMVCAYTVAAERDEGWAVAGLALVLGAQFFGEWQDHGSDYPFDILVFGGVWLFGRGTRSWRNAAVRAEEHQRDLTRLAVAEERTRIARELHDVVAHSLSVIAVQADAAEAALAKDPTLAGAPMLAIRDSARDALVDMRQLLHVLRTHEDDDTLRPARGLADLDELVSGMQNSGLPLRVDIRTGDPLPSGLELAVYRIAQEGLTNVRKHAGDVPTRLVVSRDDRTLRVEVHNDAATERPLVASQLSTGHGLIGVRERAYAAGGSVEAGPTASGGFELRALLPIGRSER